VIEISRHHVGAAAEHRSQRLRAALEVDQFDIEPGLLVFAELLCQHRRQVAEAASAADRDGDLGLRRRRTRGQHQRAERDRKLAETLHRLSSLRAADWRRP
jgi:hypothetical protein